MKLNTQVSLEETNAEYKKFVEKFKPKKTTDDCYTPPEIYEAIREWVFERYKLKNDQIITRPFFPGGDYERYEYPEGTIVLDNPPFSIISKIVKTYNESGIKYFLFCPYLTCLGIKGCTKIVTDANIVYENGAEVNTSFVTNLEDEIEAMTAPTLNKIINETVEKLKREKTKKLDKYIYPKEVLTSSDLGYMCKNGVDYAVRRDECTMIRALDEQKKFGKAIFGAGLLLSERAAAERAAAERAAERAAAKIWTLSEREKAIAQELGK